MTAKHILLTGPPGIGKTTLINKICDALRSTGIECQGFYTEEIRSGGRRTGFDVVTLCGNRGPLARISEREEIPSSNRREYKVGQYSVQIQSFEQTALPSLQKKSGDNKSVFVIDEIGKMELFSQTFVQSVKSIFDKPNSTILATIPIARGKPLPFVEELRHRSDTLVFTISQNNRDSILQDIVNAVKHSAQSQSS
ncbi:cancer-related nucleoside-triphosphatase [Patella vulgata]|uniref:cancer-related nucleoside-triphosphatase n=1 Tax=Patella vulgata TaxID=6465 RepID=UPI0024A7F853|nr:cancer-related nucleoside-triphosphatase [Patella vulgata]